MLYKINNKFYIKVQGYYKEVDIDVNGSDLDIKPNGNEIEITSVKNVIQYDTRTQKDSVITELKALKTTPKDEENNFDAFNTRTSRNIRNKRL